MKMGMIFILVVFMVVSKGTIYADKAISISYESQSIKILTEIRKATRT
jgi:hypothetical protein